ncbi:Peptidoglycan-binding Lysin subgroup [Penicillium chermesinum]|nr:Peptidoglycan-binding Lysin subgroup [Penicillium chermesinum]
MYLLFRCGITIAEFNQYNSNPSDCTKINGPVCCSKGALAIPPTEQELGECYVYTVRDGDNCATIAKAYGITEQDLNTFNNQTYAWNGCDKILPNSFICLSGGEPPYACSSSKGPVWTPGTWHGSPSEHCDLKFGNCVNSVRGSDCPTPIAGTKAPSSKATPVGATSSASKENTIRATSVKQSTTSVISTSAIANTSKPTTKATSQPTAETNTSPVVNHASFSTTLKSEPITSRTTATDKQLTFSTSSSHVPTGSELDNLPITTYDPNQTARKRAVPTGMAKSEITPRSYDDDTWDVAIYSDENCTGDYYYLFGTHEDKSTECLDLHGGLSSSPWDDSWCRWYTDGGETTSPCADSRLKSPMSWRIRNAVCMVYDGRKCTSDNSISANGVSQYSSVDDGPGECFNHRDIIPWRSLRCNTVDSMDI